VRKMRLTRWRSLQRSTSHPSRSERNELGGEGEGKRGKGWEERKERGGVGATRGRLLPAADRVLDVPVR